MRERSPITYLDQIHVPMLMTLAWQDEQLASRQTDLIAQLDDWGRNDWWATLTSGDHGMARTDTQLQDLERFYDHFLKGEDNGWETRPRVRVWWEAGRDGVEAPGWVTELDHWSEAHRTEAGELTPWVIPLAPPDTPPTQYAYVPVAGSQGVGNPRYGYPALPDVYVWPAPPPPGTAAAFTTGALTEDRTLLGSASLDLWLSATAPDVDLQVTLTEIRPDGQEVYVQQGWLRASQRALDPDRSTALRPYQTHEEADVTMLTPGEPVLARVEIFPFGHVFRAGSRPARLGRGADRTPAAVGVRPVTRARAGHDPPRRRAPKRTGPPARPGSDGSRGSARLRGRDPHAVPQRPAGMTKDEVLSTLDKDGYAVVEHAIDADEVARVKEGLEPHLEPLPPGRNAFEGFKTRRIYSIPAKTRVVDDVFLHPLVLAVAEAVLGHNQLSATVGIAIDPGEVAQVEHFDDAIYPLPRPHPEVILSTMWALDDFVPENGATVMLPGSHRWVDEHPTKTTERRFAAMPAGSVAFYVGSLWHSGGANRTDRTRLGITIEYLASWLRPQENHLVAMPTDVVAALPEQLQDLLGYNVRPPFVGYVDGRHPRRLLAEGKLPHR